MPGWLTTERVSPRSAALRVTFYQSLAAYRWAAQFASGRVVLDIGCGEGYGVAELARRAARVIALDIDPGVVRGARQRYGGERIAWLSAMAESLPIADGAIELVTCFQVLEHVRDPERFFGEVYRVLAPGGVLLLTTPNRQAVLSGVNPHHQQEYDPVLLGRRLASVFPRHEIWGVFPSERVRHYRRANRAVAERVLRLDRLGLNRRLPRRLRALAHALGTFAVRRWVNWRLASVVARIGLEDFRIERGDLEQAIDLVGVAWRE